MLAVAAVLRRRAWLAIALVASAAAVHVTTALWFAVLVGAALAVLDRRLRRVVIAGGAAGRVVLVCGGRGGTAARDGSTTMDAMWLQAVASKDSLFATQWPAVGVGREPRASSACSAGRIARASRRGERPRRMRRWSGAPRRSWRCSW